MYKRRAQCVLEYVILLSAIVAAIVMMWGRIYSATTQRLNDAASVIASGSGL